MPTTRRLKQRSRHTRKHKPQINLYPPVSYIKPGTDFYTHVNATWLKRVHIPADRPAVAITDEMQMAVNEELHALVRRAMTRPRSVDERAIGQFAKSYMSADRKRNALETVKTMLNDIGCMKTPSDVSKYVAQQLVTGVPSVFTIYDGPEDKHANHWRFHISNGTLGLPDVAYYKGDVRGGRRFYEAYKDALETLGQELGYVGLGSFAELEAAYATNIDSADDDDSKVYSGAELERAYAAIEWSAIWGAYGLADAEWKSMRFVVDAPSWLRHVNHMVRSYTIDEWRVWMRAQLLLFFGRYLPDSYMSLIDSVFFDLVGLQKHTKIPVRERLLRAVKGFMNLELSRAYKRTIESAVFQDEVRAFVETVLAATERRLRSLEWMRGPTKSTAIDKIRKLHVGVLYPSKNIDYTPPALGPNMIENILRLGRAESQKMLRDVRKKTTGEMWDNPVFSVNAFYIATGNRFVLPAAIVAPPFYDRSAGLGQKYGGLGCVIGHEITHAFDEQGKTYDARGALRNWWSAADNRAYNKRTYALEKLYNKERLLGVHIDGAQTLSENIADLGGMAIALDALKFELDKANVSDEVRQRELREFFTTYAVTWREKARREKQQLNLVVDVHSPAKYRVNNIVRHFQEWYDVFDVREGDGLYLAPNKRISIF
jgi:predicted metalloendopeptidase